MTARILMKIKNKEGHFLNSYNQHKVTEVLLLTDHNRLLLANPADDFHNFNEYQFSVKYHIEDDKSINELCGGKTLVDCVKIAKVNFKNDPKNTGNVIPLLMTQIGLYNFNLKVTKDEDSRTALFVFSHLSELDSNGTSTVVQKHFIEKEMTAPLQRTEYFDASTNCSITDPPKGFNIDLVPDIIKV
ncbi:hypothetical protein [Spirobacillus cienkowskii]|uniref:hypothetical protein n=1 Tax=Spirobacillus cienkowskii TaxID=495820 RepID=UPI0030D00165